MGSMFRRPVAATLLLLLLVQISPFTVFEPPSISSRGGNIALSIKPLHVCDGDTGRGGTFTDHQWLPALDVATLCAPTAGFSTPAPSSHPAAGHPQRLLRPPRIPSSL